MRHVKTQSQDSCAYRKLPCEQAPFQIHDRALFAIRRTCFNSSHTIGNRMWLHQPARAPAKLLHAMRMYMSNMDMDMDMSSDMLQLDMDILPPS